ncbi:hypothetical protein [Streptomyces sp. NPDC091217]|uniref:hypothetical protein n=1 Tax=Streptomyces sp. NPDC091217 TaxID=3365975 RepID=UPI00381CD822
MQVGEQGVHRGSPGSGRTADGISDSNDTGADIATGQRLFFIMLHRTSVSDQAAVITLLKGSTKEAQRLTNKFRAQSSTGTEDTFADGEFVSIGPHLRQLFFEFVQFRMARGAW